MKRLRKAIDFLKFHLQNPIFSIMKIRVYLNTPMRKKLGISFLEPNYVFFENFQKGSVIVDVGCGYSAEFSKYFLQNQNIEKVFAVEPTKKHESALSLIQKKSGEKFIHLKYALADKNTHIDFFETLENESGSLLTDHKNILNDNIRTYQVEAITLNKLLKIIKKDQVDLIKIDIEGAEFSLFGSINAEILKKFKQIFIEFHHYSVRSYHKRDAHIIIKRLKGFGLRCYSLDKVNYLFYW